MLENLRQEIETLSPEAQEQVLEFIHTLQQKEKLNLDEIKVNNYENFQKIGLIGCCSTDQNLSVNYKQVLAEGWSKKYDHS